MHWYSIVTVVLLTLSTLFFMFGFYIKSELLKVERRINNSKNKFIEQLQQVLEYAQKKYGEDFSLWNEKFRRDK